MFTARQLALHAARLAASKGAEDIRVLSLPEDAGTVFDFVVLATARSDRQTTTVVEEIFHFCKRHQSGRMPIEGSTGWMLIDCIDVVIHALSREMRDYYDIDRLWPKARDLDWEAEAAGLDDPDKPAPAPAKGRKGAKAKAKGEAKDEPAEAAPAKPAPKRRRAATRAALQEGSRDELPALPPPEITKRKRAPRR